MRFAEFLTLPEVEQIHEASLEILENTGILVRNENARRIYVQHGCHVGSKSPIVRIPRKVTEEYRKSFVSHFTFRGRDPQFDRTIPEDRPVIVTASSAPNVIDRKTGEERRATSTDIANIAFLINALPGYDIFSISTIADDAPAGQFSLARFYPALKNCLKPVRGNTPNMKELLLVLELGKLIAGSAAAYNERPIINHHCCPLVSPLAMDVDITEQLIYLIKNKLPVYCTVAPNGGMTSPMSLLGTLALGNAEFLALGVLAQMIRPATPQIYAVLSTIADMREGSYAPGGIETAILQMAHSQMAQFYNVPSGGYIGLTNAHLNDAQSGYETGMSVTAALLGGTDMFNTGGLLSSLMAFDFAKAVIDNEIGIMLKRILRGLEFSPQNFCLDSIAKVGHGGTYMEEADTFDRMRTTAVLPKIAVRDTRGIWREKGSLDAQARALNEAGKILSGDNAAVFSKEVDSGIRSRFKDLVAGNARWEN